MNTADTEAVAEAETEAEAVAKTAAGGRGVVIVVGEM